MYPPWLFLMHPRVYLLTYLLTYLVGWRRGSVVRTSVFGWRTFPDLCLIYGWQVTTSCVKCLLWVYQRGQLSLPSLWGWYMNVITWNMGSETNKRQTWAAYGCFLLHVKIVGACLAYDLQAPRPLRLWHKSAAVAVVCGLWRYISVICLCLTYLLTYLPWFLQAK